MTDAGSLLGVRDDSRLRQRTQSRTYPRMRTLSSTALRANLSAEMDKVNNDHEPVIVTRAKGRPVVMVSLEDWSSMDETAYLLSSPENARRLREAVAGLAAGKGEPHDLIEE